jgi:A/G-specific adenine glycosylase
MKNLVTTTHINRERAAQDKLFVERVLKHYKAHGRHDLIWRKKISAYRILVSEIMLQQTQVIRVIPKFEQWMKLYPTVSSLSKGTLTDVLKLWQGLGYQRRAKALYDLSQTTKSIPKSYEELVKLKGVGPYTASAICAFAYDAFPGHLLETNIRTALIEEFHQGETQIHDGILYDDLHRLNHTKKVIQVGARIWYYALMDYGAHLKSLKISHNIKSLHYTKQTPYEGSLRQLRAKTLFAITYHQPLPIDERLDSVITGLIKEGYITLQGNKYAIA